MKTFSVAEIRKLIDGTLVKGNDDLKLTGCVYYFEQLKSENTLFFVRTKRDMDFDKFRRYAPCAIITDKYFEEFDSIDNCSIVMVDDIETAFWSFIEHYKKLFDIPIIAVTGTSGKSTTKDMIKYILRRYWKVVGTVRSANAGTLNLSYLMDIDESTEAAVMETAVSRPKDLTDTFRYFKPTIGIITCIGVDHLDKCKTVEGYIAAKGEMVTLLGEGTTLLINSDDENSKKIGLERSKSRIVYFGIKNPADFKAENVRYGDNGMNFVLKYRKLSFPIFVAGYGEHQVYNALAAIAAVHELGVGIKQAGERLSSFENLHRHLQLQSGIGGCEIIDDTWNINTASLTAALKVLNNLAKGRKKVAIIGSIDDLGESSLDVHREVGDLLLDIGGVDAIITIGWDAEEIVKQAAERGFKGINRAFRNTTGAFDYIQTLLDNNTIVLAKCSMYHVSFIDLISKLKV